MVRSEVGSVRPVLLTILVGGILWRLGLGTARGQGGLRIIPAPVRVECRSGIFRCGADTKILADAACLNEARLLAQRLRPSTGLPFPVESVADHPADGSILLTTNSPEPSLGREGYQLSVQTNGVVVRAATAAGVFYGTQTLLQMLPAEVFSPTNKNGIAWEIPCAEIRDDPRFTWRGLMLDVSRHFFTVPEVKRVLDAMALYKLNRFHWHLVDDQGWRIEIVKFPKLTKVGAWRPGVGFGLDAQLTTNYDKEGRYGGFYTQQEIREVVAYAAERHIEVIPEIEMPGHSTAALAAYPEFSCMGGPFETPERGGIFGGVYCAGNEATFAFLNEVIKEVAGLFPSRYLHIGGDEVEKSIWENCSKCRHRMQAEHLADAQGLQSYFIHRAQGMLDRYDKTLIGWSEIREGGLAPNTVLMDWIGGGAQAAAGGHDVIMSPTAFCYFDFYQSTNRFAEPKAIGGFTPLEKVYSFEPVPNRLSPASQEHFLGAQANLWTEYVPSLRHAEYMLFPRLCALAEVVWSPKAARNWNDFRERVAANQSRLDSLGITYRPLPRRWF